MATVTLEETYGTARPALASHVLEPANWTSFYAAMVEVDVGAWQAPGDRIRGASRILGRTVRWEAELLEFEPERHVDLVVRSEVLPDVRQTWTYADTDAGGTRVSVMMSTAETNSWFGALIDRTIVPRALERDLAATLQKIGELESVGFH